MFSCTVPKLRDARHGQLENFISEKMPVGYKMQRYPAEVAVSAVFKRNSGPPPALPDEALRFRSFVLIFLFRSAFVKKMHFAKIFFTVEEVNILREIAWARGAYQYAKE